MKRDRLLNPEMVAEAAKLGHTEYLCIADCGLPIPKGVKVIDVSVVKGVPGFMEVLRAMSQELVVESYLIASEMKCANPALQRDVQNELKDMPYTEIPHEEFKKITAQAKCVIRTGEASSYANIILVGGVNF